MVEAILQTRPFGSLLCSQFCEAESIELSDDGADRLEVSCSPHKNRVYHRTASATILTHSMLFSTIFSILAFEQL